MAYVLPECGFVFINSCVPNSYIIFVACYVSFAVENDC